MWSALRRWRGAGAARRALLAGAALAVLLALSARRDVRASTERVFREQPRALAHLLADWRTQRAILPEPDGAGVAVGADAWRVEEESGAAAAWRYAVRVQCGARCAARAWLEALDLGDGAHELRLRYRTCTRLPLLPWPELCDEWQSVARVTEAGGGGAHYSETLWTRCARWGWGWDWGGGGGGGGGGGCGARAEAALHARVARLAALLGERT